MKLKKIISNGVIFSLFISNCIYSKSLATSDYYEYISGKILNINNTFSDSIEEIEVFGETVQNPGDLSDIKSVGDLYTDSSGNPILDKKGNKQYKIKLTSRNVNLLNEKDIIQGVHDYGAAGVIPNFRDINKRLTLSPQKAIPVKPNTTITCVSDKFHFGVAELSNGISLGDTGWQESKVTITTKPETTHIAFNISKGTTVPGNDIITPDDLLPGDIMVYYGDEVIDLQECMSKEIEIILPHQLQKVGDISDKLYFDKSSNSFIVEKNIEDLTLTGNEEWYLVNGSDPDSFTKNTLYLGVYKGFEFTHASKVMSDKFVQPSNTILSADVEGITIRNNAQSIPTLYIKVASNKLSSVSLTGFKNWLKDNNTLVKYKLSSPQISRVYLNKEMLGFYEGQTNIFVNTPNSIQPDINVKVNKLNNLAIDAVTTALTDGTTESISNARNLVNQMKESILKDTLQEKLNSIFDTQGLVLEKKSVTNNADIYIKFRNTLSLSLDTNSVVFDDFTGIEDIEMIGAINATVNSDLPYEVNTYLDSPIQNKDNTVILPPNIVSIKEGSKSSYDTFAQLDTPIKLSDNNTPGANNTHRIDIKLNKGLINKADVYKTAIKIEVNQK